MGLRGKESREGVNVVPPQCAWELWRERQGRNETKLKSRKGPGKQATARETAQDGRKALRGKESLAGRRRQESVPGHPDSLGSSFRTVKNVTS